MPTVKARKKKTKLTPLEKEALVQYELARRLESYGGSGEVRTDLSLPEYVREAWHVIEPGTPFIEGWHIDLIAEYLEAVTAGELTRLLINIPPRYGKSNLISVLWPTWEWTRRPDSRWMFCSYSADLSTKHSLDRRAIIQSPWYRDRWRDKVDLSEDQNAKTEFQNTRRGVMVATSIGGTATGKGGSRVVIDDPHDPKRAESDILREEAITFFDRTLSNRLDDKKRDAIICVMQRLHERDLSARLIELGYTHLRIPAVAEERTVVHFPRSGREVIREEGDLLWPEREGAKEIQDIQAAMGSYGFAGQFQQRPAPAGGGMFQKEWFQLVAAFPVGCKWVRYWDKAGSTKDSADYTVGCLMGMTPDGRFYIADIQRDRLSAGEREKLIRETAIVDGRNVPVWIEQEPGSGGLESAENTIRNLRGFIVHAERVTGSKETRARSYAAQAEAGNVHLVHAPWIPAFLDEHIIFPNGRHDDIVDAASGAFNKLALLPTSGRVLAGGVRAHSIAFDHDPNRLAQALGGRGLARTHTLPNGSRNPFPESKFRR